MPLQGGLIFAYRAYQVANFSILDLASPGDEMVPIEGSHGVPVVLSFLLISRPGLGEHYKYLYRGREVPGLSR